jgi:hypothetical protein
MEYKNTKHEAKEEPQEEENCLPTNVCLHKVLNVNF